jgi:hypothetical protein
MCGICKNDKKIVKNSIHDDNLLEAGKTEKFPAPDQPCRDPSLWRVIFSFTKEGRAVFLSHLGMIEVFSMALLRSKIPVLYTGGFNPLPKLEICAPLSMGIYSGGEIAAIDIMAAYDTGLFIEVMNINLPEGVRIQAARNFFIPGGGKKYSLASRLWGFTYAGKQGDVDYVKARDEKKYRMLRIEPGQGSFFGLRRLSVLAVDPENPDQGQSFFTAFRFLYPEPVSNPC